MRAFIVAAFALILAGCASTWDGVKKDSAEIWEGTKEAVHEATE